MKYKAHIPTEEYGFLEIEGDNFEEVWTEYDRVTAIRDKDGWNQLDWAKIRDRYLATGEITPEDTEGCNRWQRLVINEIKKGIRRINKE